MIVSLSATGRANPARCKQRGGIGELDRGRHARADPALLGELRLEQRGAQLDERIAAEHRGQQQPVRLQRPAQLNERARQIGGPVQHQIAGDQVEARIAKRQQLGVDGDSRTGRAGEEPRRRLGGDDKPGTVPRGEDAGEAAVAGAEIERHDKFPVDDIEPVNEPVGDLGMEKIDRTAACRAVAMKAPGAAVEQRDRGSVGLLHSLPIDARRLSPMMGGDAVRRNPACPLSPDRARRHRRRPAAALPRLRCDGRRAGCAVRPMLEGDDIFRAAVVQ